MADTRHSAATGMRKVLYDDYTNKFYVESRLEALARQVATREQHTYVLNRSHDTLLRSTKRQAEAEHIIFHKKNARETTFHKELLRDHVAHRHVLSTIARAKFDNATGRRADSHLGWYGPGASKVKIQPQIEQSMRENTRSALRRQKSFRILRQRRAVPVFDRTKTTSALLRMKSEIQSRPTSDFKAKQMNHREDVSKSFTLPPIVAPDYGAVKSHGLLSRTHTPSELSDSESIKGDDTVSGRERNLSETDVFLTQNKSLSVRNYSSKLQASIQSSIDFASTLWNSASANTMKPL